MRGLAAASCTFLVATNTLSGVDAMHFDRLDRQLAANASALPTASTFKFDGNTSDLARQLYMRHQAGDTVAALPDADVPDTVQARLDKANGMAFDKLPGLVQRALLWDSGFVLDSTNKIVKMWTLTGRSMAEIFVTKQEFEAATCVVRSCASTGAPNSLSYKSELCTGTQMLTAAKCMADDSSPVEVIVHSSMWATGSDPNFSPDITIWDHAWTDGGVDYTVYAIHTAEDLVKYGNCPKVNKYSAIVIPCYRKSKASATTSAKMKEPVTSAWLDTWLLEFPKTKSTIVPSSPAKTPATSNAPATTAAPAAAASTGEPKPVSLGVILGISGGAFLLLLLIVLCLLRRHHAKDDNNDNNDNNIQVGCSNNFSNEGYRIGTEATSPSDGSRIVLNQQAGVIGGSRMISNRWTHVPNESGKAVNQQRAGRAAGNRMVSSQQTETPAGGRMISSQQAAASNDNRMILNQRTDAIGESPTIVSQHPEATRHGAGAGKIDSKQQPASLKAGGNSLWEDRAIFGARIAREKLRHETLISRGGYGEVYRGRYKGSIVVIKQLLPEARSNHHQIDALLAEAKLLVSLKHPQVVQLIGVAWNSPSDVCVVTEYMEGGNLRSLLTMFEDVQHRMHGFDNGKLKIALHIAQALTHLHLQDPIVLHRDLTSKNILLDSSLNAKLTGFGASKERSYQTMAAANADSSLWIAPEVMMGERYDQKADVYSFGVILSELDSHALPYSEIRQSRSDRHIPDTAVLQMIATGRLSVEFSQNAAHTIVALGKQCVARNPNDRPLVSEILFRLQCIVKDTRE
ncbi:Tkl protein kinase, partial [Globisporangium splendens]